ncbi:MAG: GNAT family N-acetyltransferase [Kiritimatiellae bacterium]|nr:GNAT family N-acetyltransferase [Kiritimatiellia bacterium]
MNDLPPCPPAECPALPAGFAIRPARFTDAAAIFHRIKAYPDELVPRPISEIMLNIDRFLVAVDPADQVIGTVAWSVLPELDPQALPSVEIQSLTVRHEDRRHGLGRALVARAMERIARLHARQVIVLTFTPPFFASLGFEVVSKEQLLYKLFQGCMKCAKYTSPFTCPEVAMARQLAPL